MNPTNYERDFIISSVRMLASSTIDCVDFLRQFVSWLPDLVLAVKDMKDSGMTEDEIVQKITSTMKVEQ